MTVGGFAFQGNTFEFLFGSLAGSSIPGVFSGTKPVDVMLTVGSSFTGSFATTWSNSFNTAQIKEDEPPVPNPEPSVLLLMVVGAAGLYGRFRSRKVS
jgi:hypothetical protein